MQLVAPDADTHVNADHVVDDLRQIALAHVDPHAFAPLYHRYFNAIYPLCHRRLQNHAAAEDATSLTFMKALEALPKFVPRASDRGSTVRAWLFTIARNVVVDFERRKRPQASIDASDPDSTWLIDPRPNPEVLAAQSDQNATLLTVLERLPERQRVVVELRLSGLNGPEIAEALGLSVSAMKALQARAYRTLRIHLQPPRCNGEEPTP